MSVFTEPLSPGDPRAASLLSLARTGYDTTDQVKALAGRIGIQSASLEWGGSLDAVWQRVILAASRRALLPELIRALIEDPDYTLVRPRLEEIYAAAEEEEAAEAKSKAGPADHTRVTLVGPRPFVNRSRFRDNLKSLFGAGGRLMIVDGPRNSGRSYSWVLISYVIRMTGGAPASLIDLSRFRGGQVRPDDVAEMIAADLDWPSPERDLTAQDETRGRVLLGWLKRCVRKHGSVCLVFDGLDGDNLTDATVGFIGDIAAAAGNDELDESRVVLLAFGRSLHNPNVDPFVLREPPLAAIPLTEFTGYLRAVAAEGGHDLSEEQALAFTSRFFGTPQPDPVPVSLLASSAAAMSTLVCALRVGGLSG